MNSDTREAISTIVIFIIGSIIFIGIGAHLSNKKLTEDDLECKTRFGQEWSVRDQYRSPNVCVNSEGNIKYL